MKHAGFIVGGETSKVKATGDEVGTGRQVRARSKE